MFQLRFDLNRIHDSVGKALLVRTALEQLTMQGPIFGVGAPVDSCHCLTEILYLY